MHVRKPSPGTAIALLALFFAMGGTAIAAHHYLITSTKQIKPSVLKSLSGKRGPRGATGATGAIGLTGAAGAKGPTGNEGKQGPPGPTALSGLTEVRFEVTLEETKPGSERFAGFAVAECPEGSHAISGGMELFGEEPIEEVSEREPAEFGSGDAWGVFATFKQPTGSVEAIAYCATAGDAVKASPIAPSLRRSTVAAWKQQIESRISRR